MRRDVDTLPFGSRGEAHTGIRKGTLVYYDAFEQTTDEELDAAVGVAEARFFRKLVLYPLHEETVKRMSKQPVRPYYKREDRLFEWKRARRDSRVTIENWEGKRKKYTPIDAALRHITETYDAPLFLYVTPETANQFASFASFEEWIVKLRLVLASEPPTVHPRLEKFNHRWDVAGKEK